MNSNFKELIKNVGTDTSGKWISIDHAESLACKIINDINERLLDTILVNDPETAFAIGSAISKHYGVEK